MKYTITLFLIFLSFNVLAANSGTCGSDCNWTLDETGTLTVSGSGQMDGFIYDQTPWVEHNSDIQKIIVNEGITSIGTNAFYQTNATSIKLPNTLTYIAASAFHDTKISEIVIPNSVSEMRFHALSGLNLTSLTIGDQTTFPIQENPGYNLYLFDGSNLSNLTVYCTGDVQKCNENLKKAGYDNLNIIQKPRKLIYTVEEAVKLSKPTGNKIMIRYK